MMLDASKRLTKISCFVFIFILKFCVYFVYVDVFKINPNDWFVNNDFVFISVLLLFCFCTYKNPCNFFLSTGVMKMWSFWVIV